MRSRITELRQVKASELLPDPRNWRGHPERQREALRAMMDEVGIVDAVIARETDDGLMLIDGHLRADLDADTVLPVLVVDLDEDEAGQVLATLDPLAAMAEANSEALRNLVETTAIPIDWDVLMPDAFPTQPEPETGDPDAPAVPPEEPTTERDDVWLLGDHRLMCGDSCDAEDVERLLDGAEPRLMVTDPPFGVNYDPNWRSESKTLAFAARRTDYMPAARDDTEDFSAAWSLSPAVVAYVWQGPHIVELAQSLDALGWERRHLIVWKKPHPVISRGAYSSQREFCWYAVKKGKTAKWQGPTLEPDVWEEAWENDTKHAAQKPVELMERPIRNHAGDVYEPFSGSGTTIIAAERQDRTCYAMELEPRFVDMAVSRWETYSGREAVQYHRP